MWSLFDTQCTVYVKAYRYTAVFMSACPCAYEWRQYQIKIKTAKMFQIKITNKKSFEIII